MAWTSPRTWAVAETVTAALMNTHVRDNLNWLANDRPRVGAVRTTTQSIPDNVTTAVSFTDADEFDTGPMHDTGSNPTRLTVPSGAGGLYLVVGQLAFATGTATTRRGLGFSKNGSALTGYGIFVASDNTGNCALNASFMIPLAAADYVELTAYQNNGGALNVTSRFWAYFLAF